MKTANNLVSLHPLPGEHKRDFIHFSCSCHEFHQYYACHHALAIGIHKKMFEVPPDKTMASLQRVASRGRPRKVKSALQRDETEPPHFASSQHFDAKCAHCLDGTSSVVNPIILYDKCDKGFHQECAGVRRMPKISAPWYCPHCN